MDGANEDTAMGGVDSNLMGPHSLETNGIAPALIQPALGLDLGRRTPETSSSDGNPPQIGGLSLPSRQNGEASDSSSLTEAGSAPYVPVRRFLGVVIPKPASMALPHASSRTGVVYDARMRFHTEKDTEEEEDIHPEDPRRIYEIFKALQDANLLEDETNPAGVAELPFKLWRIEARSAEPSEIALVHSQDHYRFMESLTRRVYLNHIEEKR